MRVAFASMASNTGSKFAGRTGDDFQHLRGRGLLLQDFFCLIEQPHIFNRNRRLFGEGLQELDLSVREQPRLCAGDRNRPDGKTIAQYRDSCSAAISTGYRHRAEGVVGVRVDVRDLHDTSLEYRASRRVHPTWRCGKRASVDFKHLRGKAVVRHEVEELAVEPVDKTELGLAKPRRALGNHVEHGLDVSRRATDDLEHVGGSRPAARAPLSVRG